jgi:ferric-dicitrate binding protein FerR (iron transport regulator)
MDKDQAVAGTRINTLSTPNGGQYRIILADGTKVRLNAATTLRYPKKFADDKREVEIDGEAYFEVAKDNERPFFVTSANQRIKVYGTEFNVNTYDVPGVVTTTLVEGSVEVYHTQGHFMLSPGQQTVSNAAGIKVLPVENMQQTIAWMKGEFYFDGAKIEDIMLQLERWYDIEVEYRTSVQHSFVAKIQRDVQLSEFLKILEMTGLVSFEIDGKKVVVLPKGK